VSTNIADFAGTTSWCKRFMGRNGLCVRTKTTVVQKLPHLYDERDESCKNYLAEYFSESDDNLWVSIKLKL
jgi:hypothetical protein